MALCTFEPQERRVWPYDPALESYHVPPRSCQATEGACSCAVFAFSWRVRVRLAQNSSPLPQPAMLVEPITRTLFNFQGKKCKEKKEVAESSGTELVRCGLKCVLINKQQRSQLVISKEATSEIPGEH